MKPLGNKFDIEKIKSVKRLLLLKNKTMSEKEVFFQDVQEEGLGVIECRILFSLDFSEEVEYEEY